MALQIAIAAKMKQFERDASATINQLTRYACTAIGTQCLSTASIRIRSVINTLSPVNFGDMPADHSDLKGSLLLQPDMMLQSEHAQNKTARNG